MIKAFQVMIFLFVDVVKSLGNIAHSRYQLGLELCQPLVAWVIYLQI
ncbi:hypothetical protein HMPREF9069_00124 [Atopobium sp. oral taxon 810 str. F0209]|nr:hypothetical protein HMPREF9069_00124 [Atopobium sp. oral taxon 810 str. F0209]